MGLTKTDQPSKVEQFPQKVAEVEVREIPSVQGTPVAGFKDVGGLIQHHGEFSRS